MEQIAPGTFRYDVKPVFVRWPIGDGDWHLWGPESQLPEGGIAEVYTHSIGETKGVAVLEYVAERMVLRRDGERIRFVLATFENVLE